MLDSKQSKKANSKANRESKKLILSISSVKQKGDKLPNKKRLVTLNFNLYLQL
jgi:hypothetical protein